MLISGQATIITNGNIVTIVAMKNNKKICKIWWYIYMNGTIHNEIYKIIASYKLAKIHFLINMYTK